MHNYTALGEQNSFSDSVGYKVQLFIQCRKLKDVDGIGQGYSDPICFLQTKNDVKATVWQKFGQTEMLKDNLNPDFQKSFLISYYFERHQPLRFEVCDGDNSGGSMQIIGFIETTLGQIMGSKNQTFIADLKVAGKPESQGKIVVRGDSVKESNWEAVIKFNAIGLPATTTCVVCADNNPFFEIYRGSQSDNAQFYKVFNSNIAQNTTNPQFPKFMMTGQQLCNSDKNLPLEIKFMNRSGTENIYLGSCKVTV